MPAPVKPESEPPVTTTSDAVNPVTDSLKLKLRVAVWPAASVEWLDVIVTVGATVSPGGTTTKVSIAIVGDKLAAGFELPAASWNAPAATATVPIVTVFAKGVKVAV